MWFGNLTLRIQQWLSGAAPATPFASHATLTNNLVSYWKLDETSGVRYDSVTASANDLTDNNTVMCSPAGPSGVAADFIPGNSEKLSSTSANLGVSDATSFALSAWYRCDSDGSIPYIAGRMNAPANDCDYGVAIYTNGTIFFWVGEPPGVNQLYSATSAGEGNGWHHVVATWDTSDNKLRIYLDGRLDATSAAYAGSWTTTALNTFAIGAPGAYNAEYWDGQIANVGFWSGTALDSTIVLSLYNSGNGKSYSDLTTAEKVGLVSYWNLDEVSGTRADSHGANTLTDNNTVTSVNSGPQGVVANFVAANAESLTSSISVGSGSVTLAGWINFDGSYEDYNGYARLATADAWSSNTTPLAVYGALGGLLYMQVSTDTGDTSLDSNARNLVGWHFVVVEMDTSVAPPRLRYSIDGAAVSTIGQAPAGVKITADRVQIGRIGTAANHYSDDPQARWGVWSRLLDDADTASLFNSGVGKSYADLTAAEKVGLVSYWNLDETSGNRADSHGSNTLTDNNTVTSVINAGGAMRNAAASFVAGQQEYLSINTSPLNPAAGSFTISCWTKQDVSDGAIWQTQSGHYLYYLTGFGGVMLWKDNAAHQVNTVEGNILGQWVLTICSFNGTTGSLYVYGGASGGVAATGALDADTVTGWMRIGQYNTYDGLIDEVGLWSRVLTAQERTDLWNNGEGLFYDD